MRSPLPHPASRADIVNGLLALFPGDVDRLLEPFVGSGALTLAAAEHDLANTFVVGDELNDLVAIWQLMVERPSVLSEGYEAALLSGPPASGPLRLLFDMAQTQRVGASELSAGVHAVHKLLKGRTVTYAGDYSQLVRAAQPEDLVYLDPPAPGAASAWPGGEQQDLDVSRFRQVLDTAMLRGVRLLATTELDLGLRKCRVGRATVWLSYEPPSAINTF